MLEIYLNSPKQIQRCFTWEAKESATRSHLLSTSCQMKPKPQPDLFAWGPEPVLQRWLITREGPLLTNYSETERGCEEKHVSPYRSEAGLIQA